MHRLFISHASKDRVIAKSLIDDILVGSLAVKVSEIFCTTTDGMKIESGEDWRNSILEALQNAAITLLIITPNYKESEVCISEMGAAWVSSSKVVPLIVDPINYSSVGVLQQPKQLEKLLDDKSLDRLRDLIQKVFKIDPSEIKSDRWSTKKIEFLQKIKKHLTKNPFQPPLSREEFETAIKQNNDFEKAVETLISEKSELEQFIEELKKAKDAKEVKEIEKKHNKIDPMNEFNDLCNKISSKLSKLSPIVRGIVFVSYSGKNITVGYHGWKEQLDAAISKDYITEDLEADFHTTKVMSDINQVLRDLSTFLTNKEDDLDFIEAYDENFDAPLSLSNHDFWEEAFHLDISLS